MQRTAILFLIALMAGTGCRSDESDDVRAEPPLLGADDALPDRDTVAERDSAGIVIVEVASRFPEWDVSPDTLLRLGVVEGDPSQQFDRVAHAARLSDGGVVVIDGGALEVRWFAASGRHAASYARRGAGPGELRALGEAPLVAEDTAIVYDPRNQRIFSLARGGELVSERPFEGDHRTRLLGVRGGDVIAAAVDHEFDYSREYTRAPGTVTVLESGPEGVDTIARLHGADGALWVRIVDGRPVATVMMELPFAAPLLLAVAGDEMVSVRGDEPQLVFHGMDGERVRIVRMMHDSARALTSEDRDRYVRHAVQDAEQHGRPAGPAAENARALLALLDGDHRMPLFDRLLVESDGLIWIREYRAPWAGAELQTWRILHPDGRVEGQLELSSGFDLMHADGACITGVYRDEVDVEYVVTLRTVQ